MVVTKPTLSPGVGGQRVRNPGFGSHRRRLHVRHDPTLERADPLLDQLFEWQEGPGPLHHVLDPIPILALGGRSTPREVLEATHVGVAQEDPGHQQEGSGSSMFSIRNARGRGIQISDKYTVFIRLHNYIILFVGRNEPRVIRFCFSSYLGKILDFFRVSCQLSPYSKHLAHCGWS